MTRIELVTKTLQTLYDKKQSGVTAEAIAMEIGADRSNISRDLNTLVKEGKCYKKKSRPVLFFPVSEDVPFVKEGITELPLKRNGIANKETYLDLFSTLNPSLFHQIELGKSAILYPSHLMHVLILGETGVGKSMFAKLLHDYGIEAERFTKNAPFVRFNCADYAHNPQLLMAQLFGSVKGAYTGAEMDREGVLKQANHGILFLDEIHRLPIEGQEMLFTYMDQGTFKPLGESEKVYHADVMLIGATTEEKDKLLNTFIRRIPIIIDLPSLHLRTLEERFQLFDQFTKAEVAKLGIKVKISTNSIRSFLSYDCHHNIGQLKTDIRIVFAKAYADYLTGNKEEIVIATSDLPQYIQEGLLSGVEHRKVWSILDNYTNRFYDYEPEGPDSPGDDSQKANSIYNKINLIYNRLESRSLSIEDIQKEIEHDLNEYVIQHQKHHMSHPDTETLVSFIPEHLLEVIEEMILFCEELLETKLSGKIHQALAIHVFNTIDRINSFQTLVYDDEYSLSVKYPELFRVGTKAIHLLENRLMIKIPAQEANFLVLFFSYDTLNHQAITDNVQVIVIAHGKQTATALSETANSLLRSKSVVGINARLDEKPQDVYNQLRNFIREHQIRQDVLLLVDMGSLMTFAQSLENDFDFNARAIPLVSTMHVLEASRKAMLGYSLAEVYQETLNVNGYLDSILKTYNNKIEVEEEDPSLLPKPLAVLSICMTGEGTALTIQKMLETKLELAAKKISIIPLNLVGKETVQSRIRKIEKDYRVILIVSSFAIETYIPNYDLFNVMNQKGLEEINTTVQEELTYRQMAKTIKEYYEIANIDEIINKIFNFNDQMEMLLTTRFNSSELIGLSFHLIGMMIKDNNQEVISEFVDRDGLLKANKKFVNRIQQEFTTSFNHYFVNLDKNQLNYVAYNYLSIRH